MLKIHKLAAEEKKIIGASLLLTERINNFLTTKRLEGSQMISTELSTYKQGRYLNIQASLLITNQTCSTSLINTSIRRIALLLSSLPHRQGF
jgi:hypothetical protein